MGALRPAVVVAVLLGLAACAEPGGAPGSPDASSTAPLPDGSGGTLVLRVDQTGGFVAPGGERRHGCRSRACTPTAG